MNIKDIAEKVLFSTQLEEKLSSPTHADDIHKESIISFDITSLSPGRPNELKISERGVKSDFPGLNKIDDQAERGKMLHFLANHELLATELMALALLKFPNAPEEFRQGVYKTMREEQAHTLMYMRRMRESGIEFGQLPVNDYFWRMVAPMDCPMDFVSRLSLVFEQANLDYSKHYAKLFREAGDTATAAVLEKIYHDEIEHVGHGLKWFRQWKDKGLTDWKAFTKQLHFPLTTARAKGMAPYNIKGRELAGIDDEWIKALEVTEQSRGRTPIIHWFNPNAELEMASEHAQFHAKKKHLLLEQDLRTLPITWARRDDVVLIDELPQREYVVNLKRWGFPVPEFIKKEDIPSLTERKIGGLQPWAWSPDASKLLEPCDNSIPKIAVKKWRKPLPKSLFSKYSSTQLANLLNEDYSKWCTSIEQVIHSIHKIHSIHNGDVLLKSSLSNAGRGHHRIVTTATGKIGITEKSLGWIKNTLNKQDGIIVEPWLNKLLDFSAQYEVTDQGIKLFGMTRVINDPAGRYLGTFVHTKWTSGLDSTLTKFLFKEHRLMELYRNEIPKLLSKIIDTNYRGNIGIDAMVYLDEKSHYQLRKVVEINPRITMGRVALELQKKSIPGKAGYYEIIRKSQFKCDQEFNNWLSSLKQSEADPVSGLINEGIYPINDPHKAEQFIALWHVIGSRDKKPFSTTD